MNDQTIEWTDQVTVILRPTRYLGDPILDDQIVIQVYDGESWPRSWLLEQLRTVGLGPTGNSMYRIQVQSDEIVWGGDSSAVTVLMEVAQWVGSGIVGNVAWELAKKMGTKSQAAKEESHPLTEAEAEQRSRWVVSARYKVPFESLKVESVELTNGGDSAVVQLLNPDDGTRYEIEIAPMGGTVTYQRVKRTQP